MMSEVDQSNERSSNERSSLRVGAVQELWKCLSEKWEMSEGLKMSKWTEEDHVYIGNLSGICCSLKAAWFTVAMSARPSGTAAW
jgi:hypothetical protein